MCTIATNKKQRYIIAIVVALIVALLVECGVFMSETIPTYSSDAVSLMHTQDIKQSYSGYSVSGNRYYMTENDPQIVFSNMDQSVQNLMLTISPRFLTRPKVQVFYSEAGKGYSADCSTDYLKTPLFSRYMVIRIPQGQYDGIRLDIDGDFTLKDVTVSDMPIKLRRVVTDSFDAVRTLVIFAMFAISAVVVVFWIQKEKTPRSLTMIEWLFCIACFVFYAMWAMAKTLNYGPDEAMRYQVTQFMLEHGRLPINDELIEKTWGFSYAHFPTVLCNWISFAFSKAASLFTTGSFKLLVAGRMGSVLAATGTVYYAVKISKQIFRPSTRWLFVVLVAFMPQFAFLSSYINNDSLALLGVAMILYAWVLGLKFNWEWRSAVLLAFGVSICGLSYYNSYAWILASIFLFIFSYFYQNKKDYKGFWKWFGIIVAIVLALVGYTFIRQLVLYGDLFGFKPRFYYAEIYAAEAYKPSVTKSLAEKGVSLWQMLFSPPYNFVSRTVQSFVGVFGPMNVFCADIVYTILYTVIVVGAMGVVWRAVDGMIHKRRLSVRKWTFLMGMIFSIVVIIGLVVYKSYTGDYQPQGRYAFPAFMAIMLGVAKGYEFILWHIKKQEHRYAVTASLCTGFIILSVCIFTTVYLPS